MKNAIRSILLIFMILNILISARCAGTVGPPDPVVIPGIEGTIALDVKDFIINEISIGIIGGDVTTDVTVQYEIQNLSKESGSISIGAIQPLSIYDEDEFRKVVEFEPGQTNNVLFSYKIDTLGKVFRSIYIAPNLLFNDTVYNKKVSTYSIAIFFPDSAKKIVNTSHDFEFSQQRDKYTGTWEGQQVYPLPISVKWTEMDIDISISKKITFHPFNRNLATITLFVTNNKATPVENLNLQDTFSLEEITPIGPKGEFVYYEAEYSDPRYIWTKSIKILYPQKSEVIRYTVRFKKPVMHLHGTVGLVDSHIVTVSNDVNTGMKALTLAGPEFQVFVVPSGWDLDFTKDDHHLNKHSVRVVAQAYNPAASTFQWEDRITYADRSKDDNYRWSVTHTVFRLEDSFIHASYKDWIHDGGGSDSHTGSYSSESLKGYENATVLLRGWYFDFSEEDHHIKTIAIRLVDINYSSSSGTISWKAEATYKDNNGDDNYNWKYYYEIIAFNEGAITYKEVSGDDGGRTDIDVNSKTNANLIGYKHAIVVPVGWKFNFKDDDHHINENSFHIQNVDYKPNDGKVSWQAHLNYSDENFDDDYSWRYNVAILAFNKGETRSYSTGPHTDGGDKAEKTISIDLDSLFIPITWYEGTQNGTEEGIDCGGDSPIQCMDCLEASINPGDASDADLYKLNSSLVLDTAIAAINQYATDELSKPDANAYYDSLSEFERADRYVEAVAWYVERNMDWVKDEGSWKGPQTAKRTINKSGGRNCAKAYCGDCEDFSILRAALLRSLNFNWKCVFSADHHNSVDQGQWDECEHTKKKDSGGHTYNIVYYQGKYRILDYGEMSIRQYSDCRTMHATDNIWNDHFGEHWDKQRKKPYDGNYLMNYPLDSVCPTLGWNWRTYYGDICK